LSTKADQLEWRRSKVVEMRARGMTHEEIARELQISRTSIISDIQYLRNQAKETIREQQPHWIPEERPDFVIKMLNNFFGGAR